MAFGLYCPFSLQCLCWNCDKDARSDAGLFDVYGCSPRTGLAPGNKKWHCLLLITKLSWICISSQEVQSSSVLCLHPVLSSPLCLRSQHCSHATAKTTRVKGCEFCSFVESAWHCWTTASMPWLTMEWYWPTAKRESHLVRLSQKDNAALWCLESRGGAVRCRED